MTVVFGQTVSPPGRLLQVNPDALHPARVHYRHKGKSIGRRYRSIPLYWLARLADFEDRTVSGAREAGFIISPNRNESYDSHSTLVWCILCRKASPERTEMENELRRIV